jgi:hypothetical protein
VQNNPVNFVDPQGLWIAQAIGGGVGAVFGGYSAIKSGQDFSGVMQSFLVGAAAGVLSTLPIPGVNPLLSGIVMGTGAGFLGNVTAQKLFPDPCSKGTNWESAGLSAVSGAVGGLAGSGLAGIASRQGLPVLTKFGQDVISSSVSGIVAGGLDALSQAFLR